MPSELVMEGDRSFVCRPIGICISPMPRSIYNMGVWDKSAVAWVHIEDQRTLARSQKACCCYQEECRSLENEGCAREPHVLVERCLVFV